MKKIVSFVLTMLCILGLVSCKRNNFLNDFSDYEDACLSVVQFVLDYPREFSGISSYTLDMNKGTLIIDDMYQSDDSLTPSIEKILEKGFTYIEVNEDCIIF